MYLFEQVTKQMEIGLLYKKEASLTLLQVLSARFNGIIGSEKTSLVVVPVQNFLIFRQELKKNIIPLNN
jgi:hypothetical protein